MQCELNTKRHIRCKNIFEVGHEISYRKREKFDEEKNVYMIDHRPALIHSYVVFFLRFIFATVCLLRMHTCVVYCVFICAHCLFFSFTILLIFPFFFGRLRNHLMALLKLWKPSKLLCLISIYVMARHTTTNIHASAAAAHSYTRTHMYNLFNLCLWFKFYVCKCMKSGWLLCNVVKSRWSFVLFF